jgi:serine/threonine protein kinase/Tol biopolymer transport system component
MLPGDKIGRYSIVSKIGEGGMGEVYLAEDAKLGRRVALKILPARVAGDSDRTLRFEHEAKSASALNHPNIITIYEVNEEDRALYIAMEYVEGLTLAKLIKSREMDLPRTLDIAIQIGAALAAAHEANVIHRDIKPDNIIVRPDGLIKVLDFGLAKLTEKTSEYNLEALTTLVKTSPGLIMGTVGYMSPEQARGRIVDGRSDIFSFGSLLYEMFTGRRPFTGENEVDVIASILHQDPPPMADLAPGIPHDLDLLVRKTLRKKLDERYQTVPELLADLRDLRQDLTLELNSGRVQTRTVDVNNPNVTGNGYARPVTTGRRSGFSTKSLSGFISEEVRLHPLLATVLVLMVLATATYVGVKWYASQQRPDAFQTMRMTKLTSTGNVESGQAAVSPEGKLIAYVMQEARRQSLWVKQTSTASNIQIVGPAAVTYKGVTFSPDSAFIYYAAAEKQGIPSIYQIPALGGTTPRKLVTDANGPISFSPDGARFSFVRKETSLMTANIDGSSVQSIAKLADGRGLNRTSWSPDGRSIVAAVFSPTDSRDHLVVINVEDGSERLLPSPPWLLIRGMAWLPDSSGLIVNGRDPETQLLQVWHISQPNGEPRRVTNDLSSYQGVSLTGDGGTIVSTQHTYLSNLWVGSQSGAQAPARITSEVGTHDGMSGVAWTPAGGIVYTTRIKEDQDLWIVNSDGSGKRQLTFDQENNFSPAVTPDGRSIVFISTREGNTAVWRMDIGGENAVRLTDRPGSPGAPALTPDGKWVFYPSTDGDRKTTIWKVSIEGGPLAQVTNIESRRPIVSPDGKYIACEFGEAGEDSEVKLAIIPVGGGEPARLLEMPPVLRSRIFRWSPDGKAFIYVESRNGVDNLWSQPINGEAPKQLTNFEGDRIFRFDVSRNGEFVLARGVDSSDVVMINNFR